MKGPLWLSLALLLRATWAQDENPVTRVVGLLQSLKSRIEKDGDGEQASYDKLACWCEETTGKSAGTITSLKDLLKTTGNTILRLKGSVATYAAEIKGLTADIKSNQDQQDEATSIRGKANAAYMAERSETEQALAAMQKGIAVLKAATIKSAAFVQTSQWSNAVSDIIAMVSQASLSTKVNDKQLTMLTQLSGKDASAYAPQSATIQGILSDMYTTFSNNLQTSTAAEAKSVRNYEDLMASYQKQMNTMQETIVKKEQKKSEDEIQLADATQTYADSEEQLKAEISLFDKTKKSCTTKTSDWSKRSSLRKTELDGIKEALKILTSDDAKATFAKSIKPGFSGGGAASFIQVDSVTGNDANKAITALETHARKTQSFRLASLASAIRMQDAGHFDGVLKSIDDLLAQLDAEEKADIAKVNDCKSKYQDINQNKNNLDWKIENNKAKVQKHDKAIKEKNAAKKVTIKDIETADKTLKDMLKKRTDENDAYKKAKADDEKAIGLLQKAKAALAKYYRDQAFLQKPEPDLKLSGKNSAANQNKGVTNLLDMIIEDLNAELAEGKAAEAKAQADYETMKKAVEDQKAKLTKGKINLEGQIAQEGTAKTAEEDLKKGNEKDLGDEKKTEADLKKTCDDAIKLQPDRREKRKTEAEGLRQARDFLAGMASDAFVQSSARSSAKTVFPSFQSLSFLQQRRTL